MLQQLSRRLKPSPRKKKPTRRVKRVSCHSHPEKLKLVFVGTEVAPWSKVGGLGDVMHALPVALASQGHRVMTVVPRYGFYKDVTETGLVVPLKGRVEMNEGNKSSHHSRLHLCQKDGVDRVFVEHPAFAREQRDKESCTSPASMIYPYHPTWARESFEVGCSVLCQSAVFAPLLLWEDALVHDCFVADLMQRTKQPFTEDMVVLTEDLKVGENRGVGVAGCSGLVFVCNDWPCGMLPFWIKHYSEQHENSKSEPRKSNRAVKKSNFLYTVRDELMTEDRKQKDESPDQGRALAAVASKMMEKGSPLQEQEVVSAELNGNEGIGGTGRQSSVGKTGTDFALTPSRILQHSKTVFLIHNMEFRGPSLVDSIHRLDLQDCFQQFCSEPAEKGVLFGSSNAQLHGLLLMKNLQWLEAGMFESDSVVTVSPGYEQELREKLTSGDSKVLKDMVITGIMNGIDTNVWCPRKDPYLTPTEHYSFCDVDRGKANAKLRLQRAFGLDIDAKSPLFGFVGRLDYQKGVDVLLMAILQFFMEPQNGQAQFVLLGCGNAGLEAHLEAIEYWFPGRAVGMTSFNERLAHQIHAASDFLIVPSRFEPCGLVALSAVHYGTIPIAPAVGGLKEIVHVDRFGHPPLGIEIEQWHQSEDRLRGKSCALHRALQSAMELYGTREFRRQQRRCMFADVSWDRPLRQWHDHLLSVFLK